MKLPPELEFYEDIHLLIYRPQGVIDETTVKKVVSVLEDLKPDWKSRSIDFRIRSLPTKLSSISKTSLNSLYVDACLIRGIRPVKSAILATDSTMIHYARLHALLTQGSPINVRVFKDRQDAADWLGVPHERLEIKRDSL